MQCTLPILRFLGVFLMMLVSCQSSSTTKHAGGVALSFDDLFLEEWHELRPLLKQYDARVTFYITCDTLTEHQRQLIQDLQSDGHEIGFHGTIHGNARQMIKSLGTEGFIKTEIEPGMRYLRSIGIHPKSYAHPGGNNTKEGDEALLAYGFTNLRDVAKSQRRYKGVKLYNVPPDYMDHVYYKFNGKRQLHALQIDIETPIKQEDMRNALLKAKNTGTALMLFGHQPLPTDPPQNAYGFDIHFLTYILSESQKMGLRFYTMSELQ